MDGPRDGKARGHGHGTAMVGLYALCALDGRQDLRCRIGCVDPSDAKARGPADTVCRSADFLVFTRITGTLSFPGDTGTAGMRLCSAPVNYAALLFPDFSLIVLGYVLCRFTQLNRTVWQAVEALVYYLLFPVLLFHSIVKSPVDWGATSSLLAAGVSAALIGIAIAYSLPWWPGLRGRIDAREHAGAVQVAFRFNSFIGLALASRLAGPEGLLFISVLIGVSMARGSNQNFLGQLVRNPLIVGTLSGLVFSALGLKLPALIEPSVSRIGAASIALGLMSAGAGMQFGALAAGKLLAVCLLAVRHLVQPLVAYAMVRAFGLSGAQALILMAFSALPTASSCYVLAARMGYNGSYVAGLVTLSTLLGVLSLPFALSLLQY
jgi:predicted permease